jgi:hypothetical protein
MKVVKIARVVMLGDDTGRFLKTESTPSRPYMQSMKSRTATGLPPKTSKAQILITFHNIHFASVAIKKAMVTIFSTGTKPLVLDVLPCEQKLCQDHFPAMTAS